MKTRRAVLSSRKLAQNIVISYENGSIWRPQVVVITASCRSSKTKTRRETLEDIKTPKLNIKSATSQIPGEEMNKLSKTADQETSIT